MIAHANLPSVPKVVRALRYDAALYLPRPYRLERAMR
jgi:hypothetical protein